MININYLLNLLILSNIPISHKVIIKLEPPYERKGKVTPQRLPS